MPETPDISNRALFGRMSLEGWAGLIATIFIAGGAWYSLAGDVKDNKAAVDDIKEEQVSIGQDIAAIKASGAHQERDIQRILKILEERAKQ